MQMTRLLDPQPVACDGSVQLATAALPGIFEGPGYGPAIARGLAAGAVKHGLPKLGSPWCWLFAGGLAFYRPGPAPLRLSEA